MVSNSNGARTIDNRMLCSTQEKNRDVHRREIRNMSECCTCNARITLVLFPFKLLLQVALFLFRCFVSFCSLCRSVRLFAGAIPVAVHALSRPITLTVLSTEHSRLVIDPSITSPCSAKALWVLHSVSSSRPSKHVYSSLSFSRYTSSSYSYQVEFILITEFIPV